MKRRRYAKHRHYYSLIFLINIDLHFPNMWFLRHQRWVFIGHIRFPSSGVGIKYFMRNFCKLHIILRQCSMQTQLLLNLLFSFLFSQSPLCFLIELSCQFFLMCSSLLFCSHLILEKKKPQAIKTCEP